MLRQPEYRDTVSWLMCLMFLVETKKKKKGQVKNSNNKKHIKRKKNNERNKYIFQLCQGNDKLKVEKSERVN